VADAFDDMLRANERFAATFRRPGTQGQAARGLALITCMDARLDPLAMLGLNPGDAVLLRNAGARVTDDVLRTLVLATRLLDVTRVLVLAHTHCRMTTATDRQVHDTMWRTANLDTRSLNFGTITDQHEVLDGDVQRIRSSPFLADDLAVSGGIYDLDTGLIEILTSA
jgi:carbonic anhydrase